MKTLFVSLTACLLLISCSATSTPDLIDKSDQIHLDSLQTAYFASGCFWCVEAVFESVRGVEEAVSGYAGGTEKNPSYSEVSAGRTGHAETVMVYYDPQVVSFATLVDVFFASHDPSTLDRQGPDSGTQYRSIAFYQNQEEERIIREKINRYLEDGTFSEISTDVVPFTRFWQAEGYHQDYERLHPNQPYIQSVSIPRLNAFKRKMPEVLK